MKELERLKYVLKNIERGQEVVIVSTGEWLQNSDRYLVDLLVDLGIDDSLAKDYQ